MNAVSRLAVFAWLLIASFTMAVRADASALRSVAAPSVPLLPAATPATAAPDPFEKGMRYWSVTASGSRDATLGEIYFTQLNVSRYLLDHLALEYGMIFGYADAKRTPSGVLGGPELGLRWHFADYQRWSTYMEAVAGAVYQQYPLADHTLRFNFDLQPGGGVTYRFNDRMMLQGGFRWHHLSNAQVRGRAHNFGYDGPTLYLELMRSF